MSEYTLEQVDSHLIVYAAEGQKPPRMLHKVLSTRSYDLLKQLGATGKLRWEGKKLAIDPFTEIDFYYEVLADGDALLVTGKGDLSGRLFCGDPSWMIRGGILQFFSREIDFKWISLVASGPVLLEGEKKQLFLEEIEDPGAPRVIWKGDVAGAKEIKLSPFLVLQDRSGAFCNLWFEYVGKGKVASHDTQKAAWRNPEAEKAWEKDLLETSFIKKMVGQSHYYCPLDKVAKSLTFLLEIGWPIYDHAQRRVIRQGKQELEVGVEQEKIFIKGKTSYEEHHVDVSDLVGAFNRRERFIDLSPHAVGLLDSEGIEQQFGDLIDEHERISLTALNKNQFGMLESIFAEQGIKKDELIERLRACGRAEEALPSDSFCGKLHPYQQEGLNWLAFLYASGFHGLLADEMGLGKTVQVLAFFSRLTLSKPILIVMPTSLLFNWRRECERFLPGYDVYVHTGSERERVLQAKQVILTSYALLRQDSALFQECSFTCVVLDEAQTIKNPDSLTAQCCCALQADFRLAITGTPVENRLDDLWSLFAFLMPPLLGARTNMQFVSQVQKKIRPFLLRRKKSEVAQQLPSKQEQIVWIEMEDRQRAFYEEWMAKNRQGVLKKIKEDGAKAQRMEIFEAILRLRQICCDPLLIDASLEVPSAKKERLLIDLEEVISQGSKVLVYSQFTQMLKLLEKEIVARGWKYVYLDGSTKDRESVIEAFQEDQSVSIFLISLKAGGVGLNLTAADYVFLYDPWWNVAIENQAIDRAHRFGRKETVIARRYVSVLSVEEKIMRLKEHKAALAEGVLDFEGALDQLSLDDLCELLED